MAFTILPQPAHSEPVLLQGNLDAYNAQIQQAMSQYNTMLAGYGQLAPALNGLASMGQGYNTLLGQIGQTLGIGSGGWGVATPAAQQIAQAYAQARGNTTQALTNAGLGNTSAVTAAQNQNALMAAQSYGNLGAQLANQFAGYQSQLGQAGLQAQQQGLSQYAQLVGGYLQNLGQFKLPSIPNLYGESSVGARQAFVTPEVRLG